MRSHDAQHAPAGRPDVPVGRLSRRFLLTGAATAGAAGLAVTAIGAAASPALAATRPAAPGQPHQAGVSAGTQLPAGPVMVHVRDAETGDIEIFAGTREVQLRDKDLAARIALALG